MEESGGGGAPVLLMSLLALIFAASGVYVLQEPLESSRPTVEGFDVEQPTNKVRAHLWQDPIRVAMEATREDGEAEVTDEAGASVTQPSLGLRDDVPLVVLAVSLAADSALLSQEQRLRDRYAVWAALDTLGFEAADGDHLHILQTGANPTEAVKQHCWLDVTERQPLFVYELATRNALNASPFPLSKRRSKMQQIRRAQQVLVLWTEDRLFDQSDHPLACLKSVVRSLEDHPSEFMLRIVGPNSSDTLRKVDGFIKRARDDERTATFERARFFSPMATTDAVFYAPADDPEDTRWESRHLTRTIDSDLELARALVGELRNHGVRLRRPDDPPGWKPTRDPREQYHRVLLISELDTYYGRALPLSFAISLLTRDPSACAAAATNGTRGCQNTPATVLQAFKTDPREWLDLPEIQHVSYLRGLDGKEVEEQQDISADNRSPTAEARADPTAENASGPAQLDYVRRLAIELQGRQAEEPIRAIGVLGSDVYDKLLLIRALRDVFPDAVFFTTDLDARLWNRAEIRWTRNLVVASSFGLRLVEDGDQAVAASGNPTANEIVETVRQRQSQLPPFRDNYQTSVYYASLLALGVPKMADDAGRRIQHPRLFEIGRSGPRLLDRYSSGDNICDHESGAFGRIGCAAHHVWLEFAEFSGDRRWFLRFGFSAIILVAFVLSMLRRNNLLRRERMSILEQFGAWGGIIMTYMFVLVVSTEGVTYEPFALIDGISIWPTEILRLVIFFMSVFLIGRTQRLLDNNMARLSAEFKLDPKDKRWTLVEILRGFRWVLVGRSIRTEKNAGEADAEEGSEGDATEHALQRPEANEDRPSMAMQPVWRDYFYDGSRLRRAVRVFVMFVIYAAILRIFVFGNLEAIIPVRDPFGFAVDRLCLGLAVLSMVVLLLYIVDAVMLAERVIKLISTHDHNWPNATYKAWGLDPRADPRRKKALSEWLAIRLIALRTEVVGGLAVNPFFVIALFLVSRASFFDRWHLPLPVWIAMGLNVGMAIFAVVILWRSAEQARATSADIIGQLRVQAETAGDSENAEYIRAFADDVAAMSQGAFAPVWRQPFVQAILAPAAGWAATTLFESWLG